MTDSLNAGRCADSARRRQRVLNALDAARRCGSEFSVSVIARAAGVDRSFLYRHPDLLDQIHHTQTMPATGWQTTPVSTESLRADLANADQRITRLAARNRQLEHKLADMLGTRAWQESGLGAPPDIDQLQRRVTELEQHTTQLNAQLADRDQELAAARAANR